MNLHLGGGIYGKEKVKHVIEGVVNEEHQEQATG